MASLEAVLEERQKALQVSKSDTASKQFRLVADPTLSVSEICSVLNNFILYMKMADLWALVCPPTSGPLNFGWHSSPCGDWISKDANLLYDLLGLSPNSKFPMTKMQKVTGLQKDLYIYLYLYNVLIFEYCQILSGFVIGHSRLSSP